MELSKVLLLLFVTFFCMIETKGSSETGFFSLFRNLWSIITGTEKPKIEVKRPPLRRSPPRKPVRALQAGPSFALSDESSSWEDVKPIRRLDMEEVVDHAAHRRRHQGSLEEYRAYLKNNGRNVDLSMFDAQREAARKLVTGIAVPFEQLMHIVTGKLNAKEKVTETQPTTNGAGEKEKAA